MAKHQTQEFLVTTAAPLQLTRNSETGACEIYNHGPNPIWVAVGQSVDCVKNKCRKIAPESTWQLSTHFNVALWAIADTADQTTGLATILSEFS